MSWEAFKNLCHALELRFGIQVKVSTYAMAKTTVIRTALQAVEAHLLAMWQVPQTGSFGGEEPSLVETALICTFFDELTLLAAWLEYAIGAGGDLGSICHEYSFSVLSSRLLARAAVVMRGETDLERFLMTWTEIESCRQARWLATIWNRWQEPAYFLSQGFPIP
jgi:hypothetical protein